MCLVKFDSICHNDVLTFQLQYNTQSSCYTAECICKKVKCYVGLIFLVLSKSYVSGWFECHIHFPVEKTVSTMCGLPMVRGDVCAC